VQSRSEHRAVGEVVKNIMLKDTVDGEFRYGTDVAVATLVPRGLNRSH